MYIPFSMHSKAIPRSMASTRASGSIALSNGCTLAFTAIAAARPTQRRHGKCVNTQTTKGSTSVPGLLRGYATGQRGSFGLKRGWFKELDKSIKSASHALYPTRVEAWIDLRNFL